MQAVLTFGGPERIGMTMPDPYPNDLLSAGRRGAADEPVEPQGNELRRWRDEWGVTWASLTDYDKGEVVEAAINDWSDLDAYQPPDLGRQDEYAAAAEKFAADGEHLRVGGIPGFVFNVARKLRRMDNYLCDLLLEPRKVARLNELVRAELLEAIDCWAAAGADAIMFPEDWGTQDRLMISPAMWREVFKSDFTTLAGRAREHGMFVLMHSCGKITDIIGDLIECGIHCLQFDQPRLHGIDKLAEFAGKVTYWCPVDIQKTLQTRDERQIREEARLLVEQLGADGGGFVGGYYWGNEAIGLTPDVQDIACQAFVEHGTY
jgi:uroporphyrinogen decarboxylase